MAYDIADVNDTQSIVPCLWLTSTGLKSMIKAISTMMSGSSFYRSSKSTTLIE